MGQGLTSFERAMDRDERLMAVLGSRLLQDQKKVGETAEAIRLRQSGEHGSRKMPFWKDLTAARQLLSDAASLTVNKITSDQQSFHRLMMLPLRIHGPSSGAAIFAYPMPSNFYLDFRVKSGFSNSSCRQPSKSTAQTLGAFDSLGLLA